MDSTDDRAVRHAAAYCRSNSTYNFWQIISPPQVMAGNTCRISREAVGQWLEWTVVCGGP